MQLLIFISLIKWGGGLILYLHLSMKPKIGSHRFLYSTNSVQTGMEVIAPCDDFGTNTPFQFFNLIVPLTYETNFCILIYSNIR